jgi:hypothetical protein
MSEVVVALGYGYDRCSVCAGVGVLRVWIRDRDKP